MSATYQALHEQNLKGGPAGGHWEEPSHADDLQRSITRKFKPLALYYQSGLTFGELF